MEILQFLNILLHPSQIVNTIIYDVSNMTFWNFLIAYSLFFWALVNIFFMVWQTHKKRWMFMDHLLYSFIFGVAGLYLMSYIGIFPLFWSKWTSLLFFWALCIMSLFYFKKNPIDYEKDMILSKSFYVIMCILLFLACEIIKSPGSTWWWWHQFWVGIFSLLFLFFLLLKKNTRFHGITDIIFALFIFWSIVMYGFTKSDWTRHWDIVARYGIIMIWFSFLMSGLWVLYCSYKNKLSLLTKNIWL